MNRRKSVLVVIGLAAVILGFLIGDKLAFKGVTFKARVVKVYENRLLVRGLEENGINFRGEYSVSIDENTELTWKGKNIPLSEFDVGDKVEVSFTGAVQETSPARPQDVVRVRLLDDEKQECFYPEK